MNTTARPMLMDHVRELRGRLLSSFIVFAIGAGLGYFVRAQVISFLQHPLNEKLYYTSPTGSFEVVMQVCGLIGLIFALPILIYNLLRFVEPALPRGFGKLVVISTITLSFLLAIGGAAFAYFISLPAALKFFTSVGTNHLAALISVDQYFKFVFTYLATFAIIFQLPIVLFLIDYVTPLKPGGMRRIRKFVVVGAFVISLIIPSAPDPLSQMLLAIPIIGLYEVSIAVVAVRASGRARRLRRAGVPAAEAVSVVEAVIEPVSEKHVPLQPMPEPMRQQIQAPVANRRPRVAVPVMMQAAATPVQAYTAPAVPVRDPRPMTRRSVTAAPQTIDLSQYRDIAMQKPRRVVASNQLDLRAL